MGSKSNKSSRRSAKIRIASLADRTVLLPLIEAYYKFDAIKFDQRTTGRALGRLLRNKSFGRVWLVELAREPAGYAILTYNYDIEFGGVEGIITDFFVSPPYRKMGLGKKMIAVISSYCLNNAITAIELQVTRENRRARKFYESLGFEKFDRIVMGLDLALAKGPH
jgi:GNAT superfamily N-acetyltransferase